MTTFFVIHNPLMIIHYIIYVFVYLHHFLMISSLCIQLSDRMGA
jgi:hypothetical protein